MLSHRVLSVTAEVRHRVLPLKRTEGRGFARKYAVEGRAGEAEDKAEGAARGRRGWRQPPLHHGADASPRRLLSEHVVPSYARLGVARKRPQTGQSGTKAPVRAHCKRGLFDEVHSSPCVVYN